MKKMLALFVIASLVFAGGIVTNTNQSADFVRSLSRNASTDVDAAYFNPAGLTQLDDGMYLSISAQNIFQNRDIHNATTEGAFTDFDGMYHGEVYAPIFPNFYFVHKSGKTAFSLGFAPVGGGGGAEFVDGLPSIDMMMLGTAGQYLGLDTGALNPALAGYGIITGMSYAQTFSATSAYLGFQFGVAREVMENLSLSIGGRYVIAHDSFDGAIDFAGFSTTIPGMEFIDAPSETIVLGESDGTSFTTILGLNYTMGNTNIAMKYETMSELVMDYTIDETDNAGLLPAIANADMPALFGFGVSNQLMSNLSASFSMNYYFNTDVDWDWDEGTTAEDFLTNGYDMAFGVEYTLSDALMLSAGYMISESGAEDVYHSDMSHALDTNTFGLGAKYSLNSNIDLSVGYLNTTYVEGFNVLEASYPAQETYNRDARDVAFGIQYKF
jgi:long-chain fatty acid transport protein